MINIKGTAHRTSELYNILITLIVIDINDLTRRDDFYLFDRCTYDLLGIHGLLLQANYAIAVEDMHFYMNKGWRLKRPVDVHLPPVDIAEAYRPLIDTCVETRDDYSEDGGLCCWQENVSKSDSHGSSGCCTACTEYIPRVRMLGGFDGISAEEKSERIRVWVDCGTYGLTKQGHRPEDISAWVLLKFRVRDNRKTHDEDIAQTLEAINSLSITEVVPGTPDYTARSGSQYGSIQGATGSHDGSNLGSGQDERQPKRRKTSGNGGEGEGEGQSQGDKIPGGGKDPLVCSLCQHRSQTLDALQQHRVNVHCCPICEEKLEGNANSGWVIPRNIQLEKLLFKENTYMKNHIFTTHLKPFQCQGCKKRFEKRALETHMKSCRYIVQDSNREIMFEGSSNMNYHLLTNLVELFHGSPTKAQMRGYMYRNRVKLYDCEIQLGIVDNLQTHSDIPHGQRVTQQRGRRARRNPLHRQPGASDSGFVSLQQSPNSSDVSGMAIGDASPPASNNGSFVLGSTSAVQSHSNRLQSVFHNQPGVQQLFQPVADSQDKSTQLSIELYRLQQIPQAGYPDRGSVFSPQAHPYANTSRFNSNTADGGSTSAYHGRSSQEIMRAASPGQESFFTEFIHDSRNLSTQTSRPASAGCDSRTTFPSTGPKGIFQSWNEQRPEHAEPRHHSSPPGPAFGVAPAAPRQNTMDPVDEFLEMPTPEQNAGGEPPPADVLFTPANIPSAPLDGLSPALAREQDIIPNSSTSANPTNKDQNSGEETMKYGLTETELDSLGYNVWNILDDVMIVWQKSSVRARAASAGNVLVKLLYRDSCPLIDAILTHGVDKGVVNRSDVSQQRPPQRPSFEHSTTLSCPATASRESPAGDRPSSARVPGKDIATTSADITDDNNDYEEGIVKHGLTVTDLNLLGYIICQNLDTFMKWWQILSASAADNGRIIAKLLYSDSCPLIQAILTHGVDKGVVNWVDIAPRQRSLPQNPGRAEVSVIDSAMGASVTVHHSSELTDL